MGGKKAALECTSDGHGDHNEGSDCDKHAVGEVNPLLGRIPAQTMARVIVIIAVPTLMTLSDAAATACSCTGDAAVS